MRGLCVLIAVLLCASCAMHPGDESDPPVAIIFDTDMGSDCDDADPNRFPAATSAGEEAADQVELGARPELDHHRGG